MNKIKNNKLLIAVIAVFVVCVIAAGIFFNQALNAKYATVGNGTADGQIAKFDVQIDDTSTGYGWQGKLDPFQGNTLTYKYKVTNGSDVKVKCEPTSITGLPNYLSVESKPAVTLEPGKTADGTVTIKLADGYTATEDATSSVDIDFTATQLAE